MKKNVFLIIASLLMFCTTHYAESRQYNIGYLIELIQNADDEGIHLFFSDPRYASKVKHLVEFGEALRNKLEETYGYKPSWREAYDFCKAHLEETNFPQAYRKEFLEVLKEITKQFEKAEKKGMHVSANSLNYRGSLDPNLEMPDEIALAYCEALGGALLCIIPGGVPLGTAIIADSVKRAYDFLQEPQTTSNEPERSYSYEPELDADSWDHEW